MSATPAETALAAWKRQLDTGLRVLEAIVEGVEKAREIQLEAGVDAHAWLEANRKALAAAASSTELVALQAKFITEDLGKVAQYWMRLGANARETQAEVFKLLAEASVAAPLAAPQLRAEAFTGTIDAGFKQWLESLKWLSRAGSTTTTART